MVEKFVSSAGTPDALQENLLAAWEFTNRVGARILLQANLLKNIHPSSHIFIVFSVGYIQISQNLVARSASYFALGELALAVLRDFA